VDSNIKSKAKFSHCRKWRYALKRKWDKGGIRLFVGLKPYKLHCLGLTKGVLRKDTTSI